MRNWDNSRWKIHEELYDFHMDNEGEMYVFLMDNEGEMAQDK